MVGLWNLINKSINVGVSFVDDVSRRLSLSDRGYKSESVDTGNYLIFGDSDSQCQMDGWMKSIYVTNNADRMNPKLKIEALVGAGEMFIDRNKSGVYFKEDVGSGLEHGDKVLLGPDRTTEIELEYEPDLKDGDSDEGIVFLKSREGRYDGIECDSSGVYFIGT